MSQAFDVSTFKFPPDEPPVVHTWVTDGYPMPPLADAKAAMKQVPGIMTDEQHSKHDAGACGRTGDSSMRYMAFDRLVEELKKMGHGVAAIRWGIHWLYSYGMLDFHFRDKQPPPSMSEIQKRKRAGLPVKVNGQYVPEVLKERSGPPEEVRFVETTKRLWNWWTEGCEFPNESAATAQEPNKSFIPPEHKAATPDLETEPLRYIVFALREFASIEEEIQRRADGTTHVPLMNRFSERRRELFGEHENRADIGMTFLGKALRYLNESRLKLPDDEAVIRRAVDAIQMRCLAWRPMMRPDQYSYPRYDADSGQKYLNFTELDDAEMNKIIDDHIAQKDLTRQARLVADELEGIANRLGHILQADSAKVFSGGTPNAKLIAPRPKRHLCDVVAALLGFATDHRSKEFPTDAMRRLHELDVEFGAIILSEGIPEPPAPTSGRDFLTYSKLEYERVGQEPPTWRIIAAQHHWWMRMRGIGLASGFAPDVNVHNQPPVPREGTLGQLISKLDGIEYALDDNRRKAERMGPGEALGFLTRSAAANAFDRSMYPGIDRIEVLCNLHCNGSGLKAHSVRVLHALICKKTGLLRGNADLLTLEQAADVLEVKSGKKSEHPTGQSETPEFIEPKADASENWKQQFAKLPPAIQNAYLAYELAESEKGKRLGDREAYDYLRENGIPGNENTQGNLAGYELPDFSTFSRYLREARKALGEQKYNMRARRSHGGSIARREDVEPKQDDD